MPSSTPGLPASSADLPWHAETAEIVASQLAVDPTTGLTAAEAQTRRQRHGPNRLAEPAPRPVWLKFLDQFRSFLVIVLLGAAVLAGAVGDLKDAVVIAIVVFISALPLWSGRQKPIQILGAREFVSQPFSQHVEQRQLVGFSQMKARIANREGGGVERYMLLDKFGWALRIVLGSLSQVRGTAQDSTKQLPHSKRLSKNSSLIFKKNFSWARPYPTV